MNGTSCVKDPVFQQYARIMAEAGDDVARARTLWTEWWEREGHRIARREVFGGGDPLTADRAFDAIENGLDVMLGQAQIVDPALWRKQILKAAADDELLELPAKRWRQFGMVPGQEAGKSGPLTTLVNGAFEGLYGAPSGHRGGVIYQHYYEWKLDLLRKAHEGKIITVDTLIDAGYAKDRLAAKEILMMGDRAPAIRMLKEYTWVTMSDLDAAAASYAKHTADSMMYQMSAVSVLGKKASRVYPWGRAQTDYLGYWTKKLLEPTTFQAQLGRKGIGPAKTVNTGVNLRLADRIAHIATIGTPGEQPDAYSPEWFVKRTSFLPVVFDGSMIVDNSVSPGPLASWAVNFIPDDDDTENPGLQAFSPLKRLFEEIHPQHRIFNDYMNDIGEPGDVGGHLLDAILPTSPTSLRRLVGSELSAALASLNISPAWLYEAMIRETEPPYYRSYAAVEYGDWLNSMDIADLIPGTAQGTPWFDGMEAAREAAAKKAYQRDGYETLKRNYGSPAIFTDDASYAKFWLSLADRLQENIDAGNVPAGLAENFLANLEAVSGPLQEGSDIGSYDDKQARREFIDAAVDIFYGLPQEERYALQLLNPGLTVNLVTWMQVEGRVPDEWADAVANGKIVVDGSRRLEAFRAGREDGWLVPRSSEDIEFDIGNSINRSVSGYLRWMFEWSTGEAWGKQTERDGEATAWGRGTTTLGPEHVAYVKPVLDAIGVDIPSEWGSDSTGWTMTNADFKRVLGAVKDSHNFKWEQDVEITNVFNSTTTGAALMDLVDEAKDFSDEYGVNTPLEWETIPDVEELDWPGGSVESYLDMIRDGFRLEIDNPDNPHVTEATYNEGYAYLFGPLGYEEPVPPAESGLDIKVTGTPDEFRVVDGDTIAWTAPDGQDIRFRLMGINAPDNHPSETGYTDAKDDLREFLDSLGTVTLGSFEADRYGTTQKFMSFINGEAVADERLFAWLYGDGVPVWNPGEFSPNNERGLSRNVAVPEYRAWWLREGGTESEDV